MMTGPIIESANDWLRKAGARVDGAAVMLPHRFLLVPMTVASEAILKFRENDELNSRIANGIVVSTMVRIADTAFYTAVAKIIMSNNPKAGITICEHCLRGQLWPNKMKELRKGINKQIIHKMEEGLPVNIADLELVEPYYEEMFKHPLTGQISWGEREGMSLCPKHIPKPAK